MRGIETETEKVMAVGTEMITRTGTETGMIMATEPETEEETTGIEIGITIGIETETEEATTVTKQASLLVCNIYKCNYLFCYLIIKFLL